MKHETGSSVINKWQPRKQLLWILVRSVTLLFSFNKSCHVWWGCNILSAKDISLVKTVRRKLIYFIKNLWRNYFWYKFKRNVNLCHKSACQDIKERNFILEIAPIYFLKDWFFFNKYFFFVENPNMCLRIQVNITLNLKKCIFWSLWYKFKDILKKFN